MGEMTNYDHSLAQLGAASDARTERARAKKRCQAPSCWERGTVIVVESVTEIGTRLCERHRKSFLEVSS